MRKALFVFITILLLAGCQPIIKMLYGIKKPDVENEVSIKKLAYRLELDTSDIVSVNSKDFFTVLKEQGIPDGAIFDSNGEYIEYRQTDSSCNAGLFTFIPELSLDKEYNKTNKTDLNTEFKKFRDLKGNEIAIPEHADFYLLIYWTIWTGRLNKDHVKAWEDLAKKNTNCKIKIIKVNLDLQEYWDEKEREEITKRLG
jgi:hypothetical protein